MVRLASGPPIRLFLPLMPSVDPLSVRVLAPILSLPLAMVSTLFTVRLPLSVAAFFTCIVRLLSVTPDIAGAAPVITIPPVPVAEPVPVILPITVITLPPSANAPESSANSLLTFSALPIFTVPPALFMVSFAILLVRPGVVWSKKYGPELPRALITRFEPKLP